MATDLDQLSINTIRTLSMDAVQQANSGHPGTPMALAPVAYALWQRHLRFDPADPIWPDRDRFVLSVGHASMLLYALLHLAGVKAVNPKYEALGELSVPLDDIKRFRQLDSKCPGHPEYRWTSGVETTTGPLGQGLATTVGMAIASKWMGAHFNRPGFEMFSFDAWALGGDGCIMEGVAQEAASLAGHLRLDNLRWISLRGEWMARFEAYRKQYPAEADALDRMQHRRLPEGWDKDLPSFPADARGLAGRDASAEVLNAVAKNVPWLIGGSADLTPSTKTRLTFEAAGDLQAGGWGGRNLHFGIREHAMGAVMNGLSLSKVRPYGSGFLIFSDYGRPAIRLAAIMEIPVIYVFTHDSIGVGEDGPTHQPVEQILSLRAIPGLITLRPCDANEVAEAWRVILQLRHQPAALVLTRQPLPTLDRTKYAPASGLARGGYVIADAPRGNPEVLLMATGSEVSLCIAAHEQLLAEGVRSRVISMPSWELFERQAQEYREAVIPPSVTARVSVEQASTLGWERYVGLTGAKIGMRTFGASAPLLELQRKFGFEPGKVAAAAREQIARRRA